MWKLLNSVLTFRSPINIVGSGRDVVVKNLRRSIIGVAVILVILIPAAPLAVRGGPSIVTRQVQGLVINGDLVISNNTILANDTIIVYGNVVVQAGGNLTLINATLTIQKLGGRLTVNSGGHLKMVGNSTLNASPQNNVGLVINGDARILDSNITGIYGVSLNQGYLDAANAGFSLIDGMYIYNSTAYITYADIAFNNYIWLSISNVSLNRVNITSRYGSMALSVSKSNVQIWNSEMNTLRSARCIYAKYSSNLTMADTLFRCDYGIWGSESRIVASNITVLTGAQGFTYGMYLWYNDFAYIESSRIFGFVPLAIFGSRNTEVRNTYIQGSNFFESIVRDSVNLTFVNNTFVDTGLLIKGSSSEHFDHKVVNNTVNGQPLVYYFNLSDAELTGSYGELLVAWSRNVSIRNVSAGPSSLALGLVRCNNTIVEGLTLHDNRYGVYIDGSRNTRINNVLTRSNLYAGIMVRFPSGSTIISNVLSTDNAYGMHVRIEGNGNSVEILNATCIEDRLSCLGLYAYRGATANVSGLKAINTTGNRTGIIMLGAPPMKASMEQAEGLWPTQAVVISGYFSPQVYLEDVYIAGTYGTGLFVSGSYNAFIVENATISQNTGTGVHLMANSPDFRFLRTRVVDNGGTGIYSYGSRYRFEGGEIGGSPTAVYLYGSVATIRYTSLTSGTLLARWGGTLDARWSWWGTTNRSEIEARIVEIVDAGGRVGRVLYEPWLYGPATGEYTVTSGTGEADLGPIVLRYVNASNAEIGAGTYFTNPLGPMVGTLGVYDVYVSDPGRLDALWIGISYDEELLRAAGVGEKGLQVYWWDGQGWIPCSHVDVDTGGNIVWVYVAANTSPSLANLSGTPMLLAGSPAVVGGELSDTRGSAGLQRYTVYAALIVLLVLVYAVMQGRRKTS